jgi:dUTP pyrophosphatase
MQIKINLQPGAQVPTYAHGPEEDAGMDLRALLADDDYTVILPWRRALIPTGVSIELPPGFEAQVRSRSGLAHKHGVCVLNAPGTIDPSYRGDIGVVLYNAGNRPFEIHNGDRIAQLVIARYEPIQWVQSSLSGSYRGTDGFGSTGVK